MTIKNWISLFNTRLLFICFFFFVALVGESKSLDDGKSTVDGKPHIIIVLVDDMGYGDLESYNKESRIETPNIDSFTRGGMRFTDAHAPGAVCVPSRYGLLTGRYPFRINTGVRLDQPLIEEDRMTIASLLQAQGYHTAMVGKWHLGFDESDGYDSSLPGGPVDRGFDTFFGIRASTDIPPYFFIRDNYAVAPPTGHIEENNSHNWPSPKRGKQGAFWREGGIAPGLKMIDILPRLTEEAKAVIYDHDINKSNSPLMLYVALPAPHTPWLPTEPFKGNSEVGSYGDFMEMVDAKVGEVLNALDERGMSEESLVIFASDNGPTWRNRDTERFNHDSSGGLRGIKGDAHDGGHRMPFMVRWPGVVSPGSVTNQTVSFTDLLATFADIVEADLPGDAGEDSFSLLQVLTGDQPEDESVRPPVVSVSSQGVRAIQDGQWKLIEALGSGGFTDPSHIEPDPGSPEGQLYNLEEDPKETQNIWDAYPDEVKRLKELLEQYEEEGHSRL